MTPAPTAIFQTASKPVRLDGQREFRAALGTSITVIDEPHDDKSDLTILVEPGATITHLFLGRIAHASKRIVHVQERGAYHAYSLTAGGEQTTSLTVLLEGTNARAEVLAVSLAAHTTTLRQHIELTHAAPHATSRLTHRGVAGNGGSIEFTGSIAIRPGAVGSDAVMQSKNVVLDSASIIRARPAFSILVDDVACKHGATIGPLDDEALFYLRSRGVALAAARRLLLQAFLAPVIASVPDTESVHDLTRYLMTCLPFDDHSYASS